MRLHCLVEDLETARRAAAGATVIQLRLKGRPTDEVVAAGRPILELCRERGITCVVNDDVDAALALGADGVHLGRSDAGAGRARAAGLLLGLSAAGVGEALDAERAGAAYIGAGPLWPTPTKLDGDPAIGLEGLTAICEAVGVPVVGIGGIDASNARSCIEAGAAGVAVVRASVDAERVRREVDAAF